MEYASGKIYRFLYVSGCLVVLIATAFGVIYKESWAQTSSVRQRTIPQPPPVISAISPEQAAGDIAAELLVTGSAFMSGALVSLIQGSDAITLSTHFLTSNYLLATVPPGLPAGSYDVQVKNPEGGIGVRAAAYGVLPAQNDDLVGYSHAYWSTPATLRMGEPIQLGLIVQRMGGKDPLHNVAVRFYAGDPALGGAVIGDDAIPMLAPRSSASTAGVAWTLAAPGPYTLFAHIDPANQVNETLESNNVVSRTVTVLEAAFDRTPPDIDLFTIYNGIANTGSPTVTLRLQATDPPPSRGLGAVFFREYLFSQAAERWLPAQESGWLDLKQSDYIWSLVPMPGARVMLAWVADSAGNISAPARSFINYVPPLDSLALEQVRLYRYLLKPDQQLTVRLEAVSGDSDLYIWPPDFNTRPYWSSNLPGTAEDAITLVAPVGGLYQVEVHAYTATEYKLHATPSAEGVGTASVVEPLSKSEPAQPIALPEYDPDARHNVPAAPATADQMIHLPLIGR